MDKNVFYFFLLMLIAGASFSGTAQSTDLARVEYTYFPQADSDNSFRRLKTFVNFPITMGKEGSYLIPGLEYENIHFKYRDPTPFVKGEDLDRYQSFTATLAYTFKMRNDWRFAAQGGVMVASNFEKGTILRDDLLYTGAVLFIKDRTSEEVEKPWRIIFGLHYSTTSGWPFPLPVVNYYREFTPKWSYTLGVPKSNLQYGINRKHDVQAFVTLDGFFANIQDNRPLNNSDKIAENLSMTIVLAGLGYEYNFTDHLVYYLYGGHTLMNDIRLRDDDREDVFDVNQTNTFYLRSGLKFKI